MMKRLIINIVKAISGYIIFTIMINVISVLIIKHSYDKSYFEIVSLLFCDQLEVEHQILVIVVIASKKLMEGIALAILASLIFAYIINREIRIVFPEKIALRKRTSEGNNGKLTLGILIGNPNKKWLYDVKCSINCVYFKHDEDIVQRNGETYLKQSVEFIQNYYRFSFNIEDFPKTFWKQYLEKGEKYIDNDFLVITIMGQINGLGGYFRISKQYSIQDIIVDIHEPERRFKRKVRNIFTKKEKYKIDWKEFPRYIEASEYEREKIISEIYTLCNAGDIDS